MPSNRGDTPNKVAPDRGRCGDGPQDAPRVSVPGGGGKEHVRRAKTAYGRAIAAACMIYSFYVVVYLESLNTRFHFKQTTTTTDVSARTAICRNDKRIQPSNGLTDSATACYIARSRFTHRGVRFLISTLYKPQEDAKDGQTRTLM